MDAVMNLVNMSHIIKITKYIDIMIILRICDPSNNNIRKILQSTNVIPRFM